jgi:hypothetical protein
VWLSGACQSVTYRSICGTIYKTYEFAEDFKLLGVPTGPDAAVNLAHGCAYE